MDKADFLKKQRSTMRKTSDFILLKFIIVAIVAVLDTLFVIRRMPPVAMGIWGIIFCVVVYLAAFTEMNDVFRSVFKWNASNDSFEAFALIAVLLRSVSLIFIQGVTTEVFSPMLFVSIAISFAAKRAFATGIKHNIETLAASDGAYLIGSFRDEAGRKYCKAGKSDELPDVISRSYAIDPSERRGRRFVPIMFAVILLLSLVVMYIKGFSMFFTALSAMSIVAASFSGELAFVLPYNTMQSRMRRKGMVFFGYSSIASLKDVSSIIVDDKELFPPEKTAAKKMTIKTTETETAVRYVDRILKEVNSPAAGVFDGLDALNNEIPLTVEDVKYIKDQGISAKINEDKVLFGTRNLLLANNIEPYSQEKEASLIAENCIMLYLSINGELSAAMLFEYRCSEEMQKKIAEATELDFFIKTKDVALDKTLIEKDFGIKKSRIFITNEAEYEFFDEYEKNLLSGHAKVAMVSTSGTTELANTVLLAKDMASVFKFTIKSKHLGIVIGVLLCFAALLLAPSAMNFAWLLIYNLIWLLPIVVLSTYRRK